MTFEGLKRISQSSWRVSSSKPIAYEVHSHRSLFNQDDAFLADTLLGRDRRNETPISRRRLVVIDAVVHGLYGEQISSYFATHDIWAETCVVATDETTKHWATVDHVLDAIVAFGIDRRREPIIVIGGGVLCDVVGFAASLYRRGTPYVRIPTSLIGIVDAGVGIKTGVNHGGGKNRIGTYASPSVALLDPEFLRTLPERHLANGMSEILKLALVRSAELFGVIEDAAQIGLSAVFSEPAHSKVADYLMETSIHLMLEELQPNLWESNLERSVDYGHTFSPTLEMHVLPELLHGEAVAIDMALTTGISFHRGWMSEADSRRVLDVIAALGIDPWSSVLGDEELLLAALADVTKHRDGRQRIPLTRGIGGHLFANDVDGVDLRAGAAFVRDMAGSHMTRARTMT